MKRLVILLGCLALWGCGRGKPKPAAAADAFLRAVSKEECKKAWNLFSTASQARIRQESERAIREQPNYAEQFKPENFYCLSTYANRFVSCTPGSARLMSVDRTNAVVIVSRREGKDFLIPGFFPTKFTNVPVEVNMVLEDNAWKIDLVKPTSDYLRAMEARERAKNRERKMIEEWQSRRAAATPPPAVTSTNEQ